MPALEKQKSRKLNFNLTDLDELDNYLAIHQCYPWDAPGMPPAGPDFVNMFLDGQKSIKFAKGTPKAEREAVKAFNKELEDAALESAYKLYAKALRKPKSVAVNMQFGTTYRDSVSFVPGHIWGSYYDMVDAGDENFVPRKATPVNGPVRADVMMIGKLPGFDEDRLSANFVGPTAAILLQSLRTCGIYDARSWYVTTVLKFKPKTSSSAIKAAWRANMLPLLHQELRIVRPKYILCLGAEAVKAIFIGKDNNYTVSNLEGRVVPYKFPIHLNAADPPVYHEAQVMAVNSPGDVQRDDSKRRQLEQGLTRFSFLIQGNTIPELETDLDHRTIRTLEEAEELIAEIDDELGKKPYKDRLVAWDAEWQGAHPNNKGSYLRTIQISWGFKKAACFVIAKPGGERAFLDEAGRPAFKRLAKLLNRMMRNKRALGHFMVSDLEWLNYYGIDPIRNCPVPLDGRKGNPAWWLLKKGEGWLDTAAMSHAVEETATLGLESLALRYTSAPRYELELEDWKAQYCREKKIKKGKLPGYGDCPDEILIPYANYDACVTYRAALELLKLVDLDHQGNCCWEPCWETMIAFPVLLEIHKTGIEVDRKRIDELTEMFMVAKTEKEEEMRRTFRWPEFNPRSLNHVKELLFGEHLNGMLDKVTGEPRRLRPKKAVSFHLQPILSTDKPPKLWTDLIARNQVHTASPGTNKQALGLLLHANPEAAKHVNSFRDWRFIDQVIKGFLRPPKVDEDQEVVVDEDGNAEYDGGIAEYICSDGRVRPYLSPTADTGRDKCSRPNLQNVSKSRDSDYERLLGPKYKHKLRSVLRASPGHALVEFDFKGAELFIMAILSGDENMIDHTRRAAYDDEGYDENGNECEGGKFAHPDYYDIHSNIAKLAFRLDCIPTKQGLKSIGKSHFRTLAKNVIFGVAYGRGAKAISMQAKEVGTDISPEEAQVVIDTIFETYPGLVGFFNAARDRAVNVGWLVSPMGRFRRFPKTADKKLQSDCERQAMNFPIQSTVASLLNRGLARMQQLIRQFNLQDDIKIVLKIHDAGLLEVKHHLIGFVKDKLIPYCMTQTLSVFPTELDGTPRGDRPYHLGVDITVDKSWGEHYPKEELELVS